MQINHDEKQNAKISGRKKVYCMSYVWGMGGVTCYGEKISLKVFISGEPTTHDTVHTH